MIVSQRIASLFKDYGFICIDPLRTWLVTQKIPSTPLFLNILKQNPSRYARSVAPWKIDPSHWVEKQRDKWVKLPDDDPTFGKTDIGAGDLGDPTWLLACKYNLSENGTVTEISVYHTPAGGGIRAGIYDDDGSGGTPSTLMGAGSQQTAIAGWNNFTVNISLTAGNWYLTQLYDNAFGKYDTGETNQLQYGYGDFPNPFGTIYGSEAWAASIYATYTPEGVAGQPYISRVQRIFGMKTFGGIQ